MEKESEIERNTRYYTEPIDIERGKRIEGLAKKIGITSKEKFAKMIEEKLDPNNRPSFGSIKGYWDGKGIPLSVFKEIVNIFNTTPEYLLYGTGDEIAKTETTDENRVPLKDIYKAIALLMDYFEDFLDTEDVSEPNDSPLYVKISNATIQKFIKNIAQLKQMQRDVDDESLYYFLSEGIEKFININDFIAEKTFYGTYIYNPKEESLVLLPEHKPENKEDKPRPEMYVLIPNECLEEPEFNFDMLSEFTKQTILYYSIQRGGNVEIEWMK